MILKVPTTIIKKVDVPISCIYLALEFATFSLILRLELTARERRETEVSLVAMAVAVSYCKPSPFLGQFPSPFVSSSLSLSRSFDIPVYMANDIRRFCEVTICFNLPFDAMASFLFTKKIMSRISSLRSC